MSDRMRICHSDTTHKEIATPYYLHHSSKVSFSKCLHKFTVSHSPGHPAPTRHLCGHKSPSFGERFPVCPTNDQRSHAERTNKLASLPMSELRSKKEVVVVGGSSCGVATFSKSCAAFNVYSETRILFMAKAFNHIYRIKV